MFHMVSRELYLETKMDALTASSQMTTEAADVWSKHSSVKRGQKN